MEPQERQEQASVPTEKRNTFVQPCPEGDAAARDLFPLHRHPSEWRGCGDACKHTWTSARNDKYFNGVSRDDRLRLARSSGYCPHLRCQLGTVGNAAANGTCPAGMCYFKLQRGAPTFGACCYTDGKFTSPGLIGHHALQRPMQKPIYRRNRIVLGGGDVRGDSSESFINANEVYPGIIVTQCPMLGDVDGTPLETLTAWKQMVNEQGISLIVQLHPYLDPDQLGATSTPSDAPSSSPDTSCNGRPAVFCQQRCVDWVGGVFANASHPLSEGVTQVSHTSPNPSSRAGAEAVLDGVVRYEYALRGRRVRHWWYRGWKDFTVPQGPGLLTAAELAREVARVVRSGSKVALVCYSGRGRSGTLISAAVGMLLEGENNTISTSDIVNAIVRLRESRDGLVETPEQFHFVRTLLGLAAPFQEPPGQALSATAQPLLPHDGSALLGKGADTSSSSAGQLHFSSAQAADGLAPNRGASNQRCPGTHTWERGITGHSAGAMVLAALAGAVVGALLMLAAVSRGAKRRQAHKRE